MLPWLVQLAAIWFIMVCAPAPYSTDLRTAIVYQRLVLQRSVSVVAHQNNVSVRTVQRYVQRYRQFDTVLPDWDIRNCNPGRNNSVTRVDVLLVVGILLEDPTLYLDELQDELIARGGQRLPITTIHRWLRRIGITRQRLWRV